MENDSEQVNVTFSGSDLEYLQKLYALFPDRMKFPTKASVIRYAVARFVDDSEGVEEGK